MIQTRPLALSFAVIAMMAAPSLQAGAEAQRRDSGNQAAQRGGSRQAPAPRTTGRAVAVPRGTVAPRRAAALPRRGGVVLGAYYYRPGYYSAFYDPFYGPFYYSYYSYYGSPYRFGPYPRYSYGQFYGPEASVRLQVSPREAEVFVDGYYAGTVDDFDGVFQRLRLEPGEHDLAIFLPGYQLFSQQLLLQPNRTFSVKHDLVPLSPGATPPSRPTPDDSRRSRVTAAPADDETPALDASVGAVSVRVQPGDAEVWIDGERWDGPQEEEALVLQVAPGPHRIEVRRDGYRGYAAEVDVRAGQTTPVNVSLPRQ
jgi:hypothetical protein